MVSPSTPAATASRLLQPLQLGRVTLRQRIALAPLTRLRADKDNVPQPMAVTYYGQRASEPGTLLVTEATVVSQRAGGYKNVPGIWSQEQMEAWRKVTHAVHARGSFIFCQLWALGRVAVADVLKSQGLDVVGASAIPTGAARNAVPRPLSGDEIRGFVEDFAQAARNAIEAGFDGVEIHGANGYLIDQFTQDVTNQRTDAYGGSVENRSRFGLEVAAAVVQAVGKDRVGYRVSPYSDFQGMGMTDPVPQYTHLVGNLSKLGLTYLHVAEEDKYEFIMDAWNSPDRPVVVAGGYTPETAVALVEDPRFAGKAPLVVAFGHLFISNPDLPFRIRNGVATSPYDESTFYGGTEHGYIDYPFSKEFEAARGAS